MVEDEEVNNTDDPPHGTEQVDMTQIIFSTSIHRGYHSENDQFPEVNGSLMLWMKNEFMYLYCAFARL